MKTAIIAITIATLYMLPGVIIAWAVAQKVEPKSEEQMESLAALLVFCTFFWPLVLLALAVFYISNHYDERHEK